MRVPMMSAGTRSGVNCRREKEPPTVRARVSSGQGLGKAGHPFEQAVPAGEQAGDQPLDEPVLPDDHPLDLEHHPFERGGICGGGVHRLRVRRLLCGVRRSHEVASMGRLGRRLRYGTNRYGAWVLVQDPLGDEQPVCSAKGCRSGATVDLRWRNPRYTTRRGSSTGWPARTMPITWPTTSPFADSCWSDCLWPPADPRRTPPGSDLPDRGRFATQTPHTTGET